MTTSAITIFTWIDDNYTAAASRQPSFEETNDATNDSLPNVSLCVDEIGCEQTS